MPVNKLESVGQITDEKQKLEMLHNIQLDAGLIRRFASLIDLTASHIDNNTYDTVNAIKDGFKAVTDSLSQLTGTLTELFTKADTKAAEQDSQLTDALTTSANSASDAFVGEGNSAVAVSGNEPILVAIAGIDTTLTERLAANTEAIKQASKEEQQVQIDQTKALIANETKRQQAEDRNRLLNGSKNKEQLGNLPQKMPKLQMPKFPVNGKQFMSGLGKILKGILNPIALIAGVFFHLLPYIILAVAFFKGFWNKLSEPLKKKVKEVATKIVFYAALAFLLFKGPALLIKTLQLAWYIIKVGYAVAKWALEIAFHALRMMFTTTEHGFRMSATMFDRMCRMIEHVADLIATKLDMVLNIAAFVLKVAAIVFIVAAIVLLIGGIILLFVLFGDKIAEAVTKIIEVFAMLGGMIYDAIVGFFKLLADIVVTVIVGLIGGLVEALVKGFKWLFGGSDEDENKTTTETEIKDGVTKDIFAETLKPIRASLDALNACVASIAAIEMSRILNPVGSIFSAIATSAMNLFGGNSSIMQTANADNMSSQINNNYVATQKTDDPNETLRANVADIAKLLDKWYNDQDNSRSKHPNQL